MTCDHERAGGAEIADVDARAVPLHPDYNTDLISVLAAWAILNSVLRS